MKVLIIGAGIGGLALAGFFEKTGIDYLVIEKDKEFRSGFSLGMWSNGRTVLKELGLSDKFDETVVPYHELIIKDTTGRVLKQYNLQKFYIDFGLGYCHLHRADLHAWLASKVAKDKVQMGKTLDDIDQQRFDLVVGADGIHSQVREQYFQPHIERYINWRCWYVKPKKRITQPYTVTEFLAAGLSINLFDEGNETLAVLCAKADHQIRKSKIGSIEDLKQMFARISISKELLQDIKDSEVLPTDLAEVNLRRWHKDNKVLIGDAAHAFSPHAGLGASMALEDAYVLAAKLAQVSENFSIEQALSQYQRERKQRVKLAHKLTNKMRGWATIANPIARSLADKIIKYVPERYYSKDYIDLMKSELH